MHPTPETPRPTPIIVWWTLWLSMLAGLTMVQFLVGAGQVASPNTGNLAVVIGAAEFLASCVIRWLVLPRMMSHRKALPIFIMGLALAEGCGIIGAILGQEHRPTLLALGFLGLLQFAPTFAGKLEA